MYLVEIFKIFFTTNSDALLKALWERGGGDACLQNVYSVAGLTLINHVIGMNF